MTKTSIQAIRAMVELAKLPQNDFEGAMSIAERIDAPRNYLGKLLQQLSNQKLLVSQKGFGGGFCLAKRPEKITLFEIVEPIENVSRRRVCLLGKKRCSDAQPCEIHDKWKRAQDAYMSFLKETTLVDLIKKRSII